MRQREKSNFSLSMAITRTIGIVFPLIAVMIFVFTMGNQACKQGNAPAAFCAVLKSVAQQPEPLR